VIGIGSMPATAAMCFQALSTAFLLIVASAGTATSKTAHKKSAKRIVFFLISTTLPSVELKIESAY